MKQNEHMKGAGAKFYFTYGTDPKYPFQGGWTVIYADSLVTAQQIFKAYHPNRPGCDFLNCADYYTEEQFEETEAFRNGNLGAWCHEAIFVRSPAEKMAASLLAHKVLCQMCAADSCAFEHEGICKFPMIYGKEAPYSEHFGCLGFAEKPKICRQKEEN